MTYAQAASKLPADSKWSWSFGNPGEGGYIEYHRAPNGERWEISNGLYDASAPFTWACESADRT
jgi:hypothetical protein